MTERLSLGVWLLWFFSFELPAKDVLGWAPWYSLSKTTLNGVAWYWPLAFWLIVFMFVLCCHFEPSIHWAWKWVVAAAMLGVFLVASRLIQKLT